MIPHRSPNIKISKSAKVTLKKPLKLHVSEEETHCFLEAVYGNLKTKQKKTFSKLCQDFLILKFSYLALGFLISIFCVSALSFTSYTIYFYFKNGSPQKDFSNFLFFQNSK